MSLLATTLEEIAASCKGIDSLQFPQSKIFTNALLANHDITNLIRDTEAHERALFSVPPAAVSSKPLHTPAESDSSAGGRRQTVFNVASGQVTTAPLARASALPRRQTAVAAVLGGEMHEKLQRSAADRRGDVDVEVLLQGTEKLCSVYEVVGAQDRIAALRKRYRNGQSTLTYYETRVVELSEKLASLNKGWMDEEADEPAVPPSTERAGQGSDLWTEEDLRREESEARVMESKQRELQARLRAMEKDLEALKRG